MDLNGKNVVIVGGLGGIGLCTSKQLMTKKLASLYILDLMASDESLQLLQALNSETKVKYFKLDVTKKDDIKSTFEEVVAELKYIDVLINNAGILDEQRVDQTIQINLLGLINTTLIALPYLAKNQKGRGGLIVNVASVLGLEPCAPLPVYTAAKFGVVGFTRSLADPYYHEVTGVAFLTICPGFTVTPLLCGVEGIFEYSGPVADEYRKVQTQTADICAENLVNAIETEENGAICILTDDVSKLAQPKVFWPLDKAN